MHTLILLHFFLVFLVYPLTAFSSAIPSHMLAREAEYEPFFQIVGRHFSIPPALLKAIARQESGCHPLVINIQGKDFHPKNPSDALALIHLAERENRSYDVGIMQINRYWIRKYKLPHHLLLNPQDNIYTGGFILHQEIKRSGFTWKAVGNYHSPTLWRARSYAGLIRRHLANILHQRP